jgi:hypothetical protein
MKTVFRLSKIQSLQELGNKCHHIYKLTSVEREEFKKNRSHLLKPIFTLKGNFANAYSDIKELKSKNNLEFRKDSAKAMELVFSMSPDFFNNFDRERIKTFTNRTLQYLRENFKEEEIAHIALHLHEETPHIHAFVVPWELQNKRGRYDSAEYKLIKTKKYTPIFLSQLQSKYWSKFEDFGLEKLDQSAKNHTELKEYYQKSTIEILEERQKTDEDIKLYQIEIEDLNKKLSTEIEKNEKFKNRILRKNEIIAELRSEVITCKSRYLKLEKLILDFFKLENLSDCIKIMKNKAVDFFSKKEDKDDFEDIDRSKNENILNDGLELPRSMEEIKKDADKRRELFKNRNKPKT